LPTYQVRYQTLRRYWGFADIQAANPEEAADKLRKSGPDNFHGEVDLTEEIGEEADLWDAPIDVFDSNTREWVPLRNY
jgi:hypothetical protein